MLDKDTEIVLLTYVAGKQCQAQLLFIHVKQLGAHIAASMCLPVTCRENKIFDYTGCRADSFFFLYLH